MGKNQNIFSPIFYNMKKKKKKTKPNDDFDLYY